jgi:hypothetical protein
VLAAELLVMAAGSYWVAQMNLDISPGQVVWRRILTVLGPSMREGRSGGWRMRCPCRLVGRPRAQSRFGQARRCPGETV